MTRQVHNYLREIDPIHREVARRHITRREQAHPDWCDYPGLHNHVGIDEPVSVAKIAGLVVFVLFLFASIAYGLAFIGMAAQG